jgi:hypothetical protein
VGHCVPRLTKAREEAITQRFLSLYGGVGRCAEERAKLGISGEVIDLSYDTANDLAKPRLQRAINDTLSKMLHCIVGIDIGCASWSRAHRAPRWISWPSALRCPGEYIWGIPHFSDAEKAQVRAGNLMAHRAVAVVKLCLSLSRHRWLLGKSTDIYDFPYSSIAANDYCRCIPANCHSCVSIWCPLSKGYCSIGAEHEYCRPQTL